MSKKIRIIPSIFKNNNKEATKQVLWQWPSCTHQPQTLSFRDHNDAFFKTVNSIFIDDLESSPTPKSLFTNSSESPSFSTDEFHEEKVDNNTHSASEDLSLETIIQGVRSSERLFFEPGSQTKSIMKEGQITNDIGSNDDNSSTSNDVLAPFKESVAMALESEDPYFDFKKSMQEMVESHGVKDWEGLEEMEGWYWKMNGRNNHGFIVGAFVDLLMGLSGNIKSSLKMANDDNSSSSDECKDSSRYSSAESSFVSSSPSPRSLTGEVSHEEDSN